MKMFNYEFRRLINLKHNMKYHVVSPISDRKRVTKLTTITKGQKGSSSNIRINIQTAYEWLMKNKKEPKKKKDDLSPKIRQKSSID